MSNADKQHAMRDWIGQHVYYCASELVHELAQKDEYMEDLWEICSQDDWEEPAEDYIRDMSLEDVVEVLEAEYAVQCYDHETIDELRTALLVNLKDENKVQEFCEDNRIDPHQHEAYEHWIVSQWFAERLIEKGEMVTKDFLGLTIWGRCCTGQAIMMDGVVEEIYDEMMARRG